MVQDLIYQAYLPTSSNQVGGDLPFFIGKQYGSGWLGTLARVAFPILKRIAGIASNAAEDVIYRDKPIKSAIADHAINALHNITTPKEASPSPINSSSSTSSRKRTQSYPLFQSKRRRRK